MKSAKEMFDDFKKKMKEEEGEVKLQKKCDDYLRKNNIMFYHIEKGRVRGKPKVHRKGWPDLFIFFKGVTIFIELKTKTGKTNPAQRATISRLIDDGFPCFVMSDFETFKSIIDIYIEKANEIEKENIQTVLKIMRTEELKRKAKKCFEN